MRQTGGELSQGGEFFRLSQALAELPFVAVESGILNGDGGLGR